MQAKPSELREEEAIKISGPGGAIGFHRYYSELQTFALDEGGDPRAVGSGMLITDDEDAADELYAKWLGLLPNAEGVSITHYDSDGCIIHSQEGKPRANTD